MEAELFRIAQEALNNSLRHAAASAVEARIDVGRDQESQYVELEVRDNGAGFEPDVARDKGGMGLVSMRERAANIGATLVVESRPGGGTRVHVRLDLKPGSG